eukprot:TRINITY_DN110752_c0_g1_i1.p1 TRINITY_DN110752_c0_g1~~TRINITY_DN110752_c0_g1_i1.p1  ORF type:complete len:142 (-),score=2.61 TRINITY_DN110752_c0_g1_i1:61-441(-)
MYRILKSADFIKSNMPLGATKENPILTDKEAYDVAAYMNQDSHYRPEKINRSSDFPDDRVKAPDVYRPNMEKKEHQFGPFGNIIKQIIQFKKEKNSFLTKQKLIYLSKITIYIFKRVITTLFYYKF